MGAGINLFKQLFPEDYYAYQTATLISSKPTSKVVKDSNDQTIATYPLGGDELRGLLKVENGNLVAFGDIHNSDGNGTEVFDIVDLGSLEWNYISWEGVNYITSNGLSTLAKKPTNDDIIGNIITELYVNVTRNSITALSDKVVALDKNGNLNVIDSAYSDAATFKTAMSGKYLLYELQTPVSTTYTPFTNPMISGSTEEFTDSRSLKMFCGHDSIYADNISFAHIDFGQTVTDGTLDVVHGILTPTGGSPISVTPALIQAFPGVNNVFSNGGGDITVFYLDVL